jgi:hypothetical protein
LKASGAVAAASPVTADVVRARADALIARMTPPRDLAYWSAVTGTWVHDASKFDVWVGGNSVADLAGSFEITAPN